MEGTNGEGGFGDQDNVNVKLPQSVMPIKVPVDADANEHDGKPNEDEISRQNEILELTERMENFTTSTSDSFHIDECESSSMNSKDEKFGKVIGVIEDIVVGEEFQGLQNLFLSTYCAKIGLGVDSEIANNANPEDSNKEQKEEFKIFRKYSQELGHLLEIELKKSFPNKEDFDFDDFLEEIGQKAEAELTGDQYATSTSTSSWFDSEIFEMLFTLTDFSKFKDLCMDYKNMVEGKTPDLATTVILKPVKTPRD